MKSKHTPLRLVKDISVGTSLGILLFGAGQSLQSCGPDNTQEYTTAESEEKIPPFSRPVKTYISETSPGQFKITDEIPVTEVGQAMAIVRYHNGKRDTLDPAGAKKLVMADSTTKGYFQDANSYYGHNHNHSSLSSVLLWGGMGYMLGRNAGMGSYNASRERQYSSGVYANSATYNRSAGIHNAYQNYRTRVAARPSGGRTGFFSRSRSGSFGS